MLVIITRFHKWYCIVFADMVSGSVSGKPWRKNSEWREQILE